MGGVSMAYLACLGVVSYRWFRQAGQAPPPITFAGTTLVFAGLGALARANDKFAGTTAWAFVLGAMLAPGVAKDVKPVQWVFGTPEQTAQNQANTAAQQAQSNKNLIDKFNRQLAQDAKRQ